MRRDDIRNVAIIAHVDHGKTTLVDCLLRQSGEFRASQLQGERILDSNDLERERGITILAKNIALPYRGVKINLIDTPGHADFGGEVERVLRMADGALVLVDALEGPMPQTRFVLTKALEAKLKPIVVVNKIDRPDARPHEVLNETFELFLDLGADEHLADFPYVFATAREGYATHDPNVPGTSMQPLLDLVLQEIPGPEIDSSAPLQMLVTTLDWSEYVGRIAIGRIYSGTVRKNQTVSLIQAGDAVRTCKVAAVNVFDKLGRTEVPEATAGDVVALVGLEEVEIGDTVADPARPVTLPRVTVDEPTMEMVFTINNSPLAGKEGKYVTSRNLRDRLYKELERNVALRVRPIEGAEAFAVAGRGVLHLAVLIETMRREGYELSVGKPQVITRKRPDGVVEEPFELLVVEVPPDKTGPVMELVGNRRGGRQSPWRDRGNENPRQLRPPGVPHSVARPAGAADEVAQRHRRHGHHPSPLPRVPADGRRTERAGQRRAGVDGVGQSRRIRPGWAATAGRAVRVARRCRLRRHDRGREQPRERHGSEPDQGKEAHQHPRGR